jgi:hypothetical protein
MIVLCEVKCRGCNEWWCLMRCARCWYFVSTCLPSLDQPRAGLGWRKRKSRFLPESWPERTPAAAIFLGLWMIGRQETTSARADRPYINTSHQRNASQIPRTESACKSIAAIQIINSKHHTDHIPHRKHDRIGQSTTSTTFHASRLPGPRTGPSSSRNGPPKLSPAGITTLTSVRDNGRACSIADCPPYKRWTLDIWPATMEANRRLAVDLDCRRQRRIVCKPRDLGKDRRYAAGPGPRRLICKWLSTHWRGDSIRRSSEPCSQARVSRRGSLWCMDRSRSMARR